MKKIFFSFVVCTLFSLTTFAQQGWEIGGWIGAAHYFGDLNTSFDVTRPGPAVGAIARYNFNTRISAKLGANYGYIGADDKYSKNAFEKQRNLNFKSNIIEGQAGFEFNFLPYVHGSYDKYFTPYVHAGMSVYHFSPKTKYNNKWVALQPLGTEGQFKNDEYALTQVAFTYGLGVKWDITDTWSANFMVSARYLFTDYLDDVSTVYPEMDDLEALHGPIAVALSDRSLPNAEGIKTGLPGRQRGDLSNNDMFSFMGVGVVYYFGEVRCPTF